MSDTNDDTRPESPEEAPPSTEGEVDLAELAAQPDGGDDEEDGLDLSDLDQLGVDGVVARLRSDDGGEDEEAMLAKVRQGPTRSPLISMLVVAFGTYLLISMFGDFRYWTRSTEPVELGHASTLLQDGRNLDAYDNQYVVIEGTPDVQNAARLTTKDQYIGYLRVTEGEGGLFAAVPRPKDQPVTNNFEGRYTGRLRRLEDDRAFEWLRQFYAHEQVTRTIDLDVAALPAALGGGALPKADGESIETAADDTIRLGFAGPDARVQLGKQSYASAEAAEQAVAALGYPYIAQPPTTVFYRFVARIPRTERDAAQAKLAAALPAEQTTRPDPKVGAFVLGMPMSYSTLAGEVSVEGDTVVFPYGNNTTTPGYDVADGRLVERSAGEAISFPTAQLHSARIERTIEVDPQGFVVAVGETPGTQWVSALLWAVALGITLLNVFLMVSWWRQRQAAA